MTLAQNSPTTAIHSPNPVRNSKPKYRREIFITMLRAANMAHEYRFAREAGLVWLAAFPGDLLVNLLYAQALLGEGRPRQALPVLHGIIQTDPEFLEANQALLKAEQQLSARTLPNTLAMVLVLGGQGLQQDTVVAWGRQLWFTRQALAQGELEQAHQLIAQVLAADPPIPLVGVTHLQILEADENTSTQAKSNLASFYQERWPGCLQFGLTLAQCLMEEGATEKAVAYLHQAAARDVGGQVAARLWGKDHPYQSIWPQELNVPLDLPVPANVAAILGWNRLPQGLPQTAYYANPEDQALPLVEAESEDGVATNGTEGKASPQSGVLPGEPNGVPLGDVIEPDIDEFFDDLGEPKEVLEDVQSELERLAHRLNRPAIARADGRFPVYVILTIQSALKSHYGDQGAAEVLSEMGLLADTIRQQTKRRSSPHLDVFSYWGARVFCPDEAERSSQLGIKPARPGDAWGIKLALADLDKALSRNGERIGAVLIVGGPEIVPFHKLPNPVEDDDKEVLSDNPYATHDDNYFFPEWPVGRIVGGAAGDPTLLLQSLRSIQKHRASQVTAEGRFLRLWNWLRGWFKPQFAGLHPSFGFTASVWRHAALDVFRTIGDPADIWVSPPKRIGAIQDANLENQPLPLAQLGYFNLHGLKDAAEWYGQRDPIEVYKGPDYPVALQPQDIQGFSETDHAYQVVFSEACYGAHIQNKSIADSVALKFLAAGTQAFIGSTCMAYGSLTQPLSAGDLLAKSFWSYLRDGLSAGDAILRAKINLAREMQQRQGYLDGEDQKTLISFVLYGDPMTQPELRGRHAKALLRPTKPEALVKTVKEEADETPPGTSVPPEVLDYVRHVVTQYLPGMEDARMHYCQERTEGTQDGNPAKSHTTAHTGRKLVTLSKQVARSERIHNHYARLTLDARGNLVKLAISR
jgi:tetratricopeptide (TPR) repeat protein